MSFEQILFHSISPFVYLRGSFRPGKKDQLRIEEPIEEKSLNFEELNKWHTLYIQF